MGRLGKLALAWNEQPFSRSHVGYSADRLLRRTYKRLAHKQDRRAVRLVLSDERVRRVSPCCDLHAVQA